MSPRVAVVLFLFSLAACAPCPTPPPPGCTTDGTGTIIVNSTGLPTGVTGTITLTGPTVQTVTATRTVSVGSGPWSVTAERATGADPLVRTVYVPSVTPASFCLTNGGTQVVTVDWAPVATSNALWAINANASNQLVGFKSAHLRATATVPADLAKQGGFGHDLAFDRDGNVWVGGATTTDKTLLRFPSTQFLTGGRATPDIELSIDGTSCIPLVAGLAFDANGNLYVSSPCRDAVLRFDAASLTASATISPSLTINVGDPQGVAFDRAGNLWVVSRMDSRVWRYDAAQLAAGSVTAPAFKLGARASSDPMNLSLLSPSWVAFDTRGDLWANDFAGNVFYRVGASALRAIDTGDVQPQVRITIGVLALLEGFAFDGEGGLWSAGSMGKLIRLGPAQLDVSSGPGAPTMPELVLTSGDLGSAGNVAFYPAPAGSPLFHALP
jgi:sugar lactone lactonase YvrE